MPQVSTRTPFLGSYPRIEKNKPANAFVPPRIKACSTCTIAKPPQNYMLKLRYQVKKGIDSRPDILRNSLKTTAISRGITHSTVIKPHAWNTLLGQFTS